MSHANAPLTPAGRLRLVQRCAHRPISHVAAEAGVARQTLTTWLRRYESLGEAGLVGRSSAPHSSPTKTPPAVVDRIEDLRRTVDGFSRLAYTETLANETAATTIGFWARARAFFAAHGITRFTRVVTDNGSNYRARDFNRSVLSIAAKHQRIRPRTPKHNGKVERYQRTLSEELLYARQWTSETQRTEAIRVWNIHYNYHRAHTAIGNQPPASKLPAGVTNLMTQNT